MPRLPELGFSAICVAAWGLLLIAGDPAVAFPPVKKLPAAATSAGGTSAAGRGLPLSALAGIVVDNDSAQLTGEWKTSSHTAPYVGQDYLHDDNQLQGQKSARFQIRLPQSGEYQVRAFYSPGKTRSSKVPVEIQTADGLKTANVNQRLPLTKNQAGQILGVFRFSADQPAVVTLSNAGADGHVIVDAIQFLPANDADVLATRVTDVQAPAHAPRQPIAELAPQRLPADLTKLLSVKLNSADIDTMLRDGIGQEPQVGLINDEQFLRRVTFDLIGRQPTLDEQAEFARDRADGKRARVIERLLDSPEFGTNQADFWGDLISYRTPQPELTFLNYIPFKAWLAEKFNENAPWDAVTREILTASGKVGKNPAATFVGFHQADAVRLAGETTRVFLSTQIQCAQCHDDPFEPWSRTQFHHMAAFFGRTDAKLPWNDSNEIEVKDRGKGEYVMPDMHDPGKKGTEMLPVAQLTANATAVPQGAPDLVRRQTLAAWVTSPQNPWFARAYVNRLWTKVIGLGFYDSADNMSLTQEARLGKLHDTLAAHFIASGFDVKGFYRLLLNSRVYQLDLPASGQTVDEPFLAGMTRRLAGDEVFRSLVTALEIPNVTPEPVKATAAFRFPPPPKSTRDLVNDAFGFDPGLDRVLVERTMQQAMWMMNNAQLQKQISADPNSGSVLARLLQEERDNDAAVAKLFRIILAREPNSQELQLAQRHLQTISDRGQGFEDILWGLLNTTEFTTRR